MGPLLDENYSWKKAETEYFLDTSHNKGYSLA